jgi:DNA polymerase-3 subunit delta'
VTVAARDEADGVWDEVVGQHGAVAQLSAAAARPVHAYLLVGPEGSGKRAAARAFAALLLSAGATGADRERHLHLALSEAHPDLRVIEPQGNTVRTEEAQAIVRAATRSPTEGSRKVVLATGFELMEPKTAGMLLKIIEEPSPSTTFVLTATELNPDLATIASRCAIVTFVPVPAGLIEAQLIDEGVAVERAAAVAAVAGGDLSRARLLAADDRVALRHDAYRRLPSRLDGTGARAAQLAAEIAAQLDDSMATVVTRQEVEAAEVQERIERYGQRGSGRRELEERHRREQRRHRTAELRFALATLAGAYRDQLATASAPGPLVAAIARIEEAAVALERYPNESLLLQALLVRLPPSAA